MPAIEFPDPPLTDGAVVLRAYADDDVPALVSICQDPEVPRWTLVPSPYGPADAQDWIERIADGLATGSRVTFAIADAADRGTLLGSVGLQAIDWDARAADVGYMLGPQARGRGFATRAVQLVARWAFGALGLERLELRTMEQNTASRAVAERAGFVRVRRLIVARPECDHMPDVYFARLRG